MANGLLLPFSIIVEFLSPWQVERFGTESAEAIAIAQGNQSTLIGDGGSQLLEKPDVFFIGNTDAAGDLRVRATRSHTTAAIPSYELERDRDHLN